MAGRIAHTQAKISRPRCDLIFRSDRFRGIVDLVGRIGGRDMCRAGVFPA